MNKYNNFTVEETNLLSIYMTGSKEGLVVAMNAALPFMEGEMRDFAARTLAKVGRMTEAEFAWLAVYPADEVLATLSGSRRPKAGKSTPLYAGRAAIMIAETVSCLTTGTSAYARSLSLIRCFANGFGLPYFPLISSCMPSFLRPRIKSVVLYAARSLYQSQTASNTARTAASVSRTDRQRSA